VLVSGSLVLDTETPNADRATRKAIMLHELGHLVGLDHTADQSQLMFSESNEVTDYQDGDRRGLALLNTRECAPGV
jgi:predicted Zn-dependent protease